MATPAASPEALASITISTADPDWIADFNSLTFEGDRVHVLDDANWLAYDLTDEGDDPIDVFYNSLTNALRRCWGQWDTMTITPAASSAHRREWTVDITSGAARLNGALRVIDPHPDALLIATRADRDAAVDGCSADVRSTIAYRMLTVDPVFYDGLTHIEPNDLGLWLATWLEDERPAIPALWCIATRLPAAEDICLVAEAYDTLLESHRQLEATQGAPVDLSAGSALMDVLGAVVDDWTGSLEELLPTAWATFT